MYLVRDLTAVLSGNVNTLLFGDIVTHWVGDLLLLGLPHILALVVGILLAGPGDFSPDLVVTVTLPLKLTVLLVLCTNWFRVSEKLAHFEIFMAHLWCTLSRCKVHIQSCTDQHKHFCKLWSSSSLAWSDTPVWWWAAVTQLQYSVIIHLSLFSPYTAALSQCDKPSHSPSHTPASPSPGTGCPTPRCTPSCRTLTWSGGRTVPHCRERELL